jgi:AraC-like DNA-binding protein
MTLNVKMRLLAHAEPHEPVLLGPEPLVPDHATAGLTGHYNILGARRGMTISAFDFTPKEVALTPMHSAPCVALNVLFDGSGHSWLEDETGKSSEIPFRPAFYCMIAPQGARGFDAIRPGARFRGIDVSMTPDFWRSLGCPELESLRGGGNPHHIASTGAVWTGILPLSPEVQAMARSLLTTIHSSGSDLTSEARALDIINAAISLLNSSDDRQAHLLQRDLRAIREVIAMMDADIAHPWQLTELAHAAGIGLKRLKQQFPKETGLPVYAWLQEARLKRAQELLSKGEISVTQISLAVGYSSLSHFSALFRRRFGISPSYQRGTVKLLATRRAKAQRA